MRASAATARRLYPDHARLALLETYNRLIVSEPLADLPGVWHEVDPSSAVIARREPYYRFDRERLNASYANPTIYDFGYLRQAHTQCLWRRQEEQAAYVIENAMAPSPFTARSCTD